MCAYTVAIIQLAVSLFDVFDGKEQECLNPVTDKNLGVDNAIKCGFYPTPINTRARIN